MSALGFAFFPFWSLLDFVRYSQGFPLRMEGYFTCQGEAKSLECGSFMHFWTVWKTRNDIVFRDEVLSIQTLKVSFCTSFLVRD